mmetsp:Transcript_11825/g.15241  ORF Transcript_11825/g.15241 Transcript_11825/m.15241 type:complete len:549 (+) Transcript_11825:32-1678(+)
MASNEETTPISAVVVDELIDAVAVPVTIATPVEAEQQQQQQQQPAAAEASGVSLTMSTEFSVYSSTLGVDTMVGINLQAPPAPSDADRAPVDCVVVSDVSGSMRGPKMDLLKSTCKLLLDEFVTKDRAGLVTFDTDVKERYLLQSVNAAGRDKAKSVVDGFRPGSSTNLSGGCFAGIQQLLSTENTKGRVRTVLLMTDGQANQGLRTSKQIIPILTNMLQDSGISLHTFGYGSDHDSELLRQISTAGNGSYYFVEGVDDIRSAFGDCLGGMLSVVAQNLEVELEAINGATITNIHHKNAVMLEENKRYKVPFADLYGEEQRDVLVGMHLPSCDTPMKDDTMKEAQVLRATLRYIDVLAAKPMNQSTSVGACRIVEVNKEDVVQNQSLALQATRIRVADTLETARAKAEAGDLASAREMIESTRKEVKEVSDRSAGSEEAEEMLPTFEDDLRECAEGLVSREAYTKVSKKMTYLAEGHYQQRCMESETISAPLPPPGSSSWGLFGGGGGGGPVGSSAPQLSAPSGLRKNAYRTKGKSAKASKFSGFSED